MELPKDIAHHIKEYSMPLPNSRYTAGLSVCEIAHLYADTWVEEHLYTSASEPDNIQYQITFTDGCRIIIMNGTELRLNAHFSIAHLREWDGCIGSRYVQIIN